MNDDNNAEVDKAIGWHLRAIAAYLAELRERKAARAAVIHFILSVDGSARAQSMVAIDLIPNLPGITELEQQLGLTPGPSGSSSDGD